MGDVSATEQIDSASSVLVERRPIEGSDGLSGWVTMNRPEDRNPMDWDTIHRLHDGFDELAGDDRVRVIFVTGAGKAFSAGGDMKRYVELQRDPVAFPEFVGDCHRLFAKIARYPKPVISLVNGVSVAGGTELLIFSDWAIAADTARIGDAHLNFGMMGGGGVLAMLAQMIGPARARELVITGRILDADEALAWGLVSRVVAADALEATAAELAAEIATKSPLAIKNAKHVINWGVWSGSDIDSRMAYEREVNARYCLSSHDAQEGLSAFAEKRKPRFEGR
jgi:enoyl-CoA hydratase/carnithine racemase